MKSFTINWASSSSSSRWVSSLNHKIGNNSVENQSIVISTTTQFCKIPARVRRMIPIQFDGDGPHGRFHVDEWRLPIFWRNPGHLEIKHFFTFLYLEFISGENTHCYHQRSTDRSKPSGDTWERQEGYCCRSATLKSGGRHLKTVSRLPYQYCNCRTSTVEVVFLVDEKKWKNWWK